MSQSSEINLLNSEAPEARDTLYSVALFFMKNRIISIILGLLGGLLGAFLFTLIPTPEPTQEELIADFYNVETAVLVSPHGLRKSMMHGDNSFILVDVRSEEEYEREHIIGAVNIPAYKDPETSAYGDVERIVNSFQTLIEENPGKEIIVYCYSVPCMTGRKVGKMLVDHDIYVKELGIGWNEWRYDWNAWNHEHEWDNTQVEDYVFSGPEPGKYEIDPTEVEPCAIDNDLGC